MEPPNAKPALPSKETPIPQPPGTTHGSIPSRHRQESAAAQRARESLKINNRIFKGYINAELIRCCALLATSEYERALSHVENASFLAEEQNFFYEISKCYLYRGLCFMGMERWKEARVALVRGVNVRGWGRKVEGLMREAHIRIDEEKKGTQETKVGV
ncbi:uncharacterized protein EAF01_004229 [Botrytis porri]|uniref:Uncharacterized protein n=1 Tax=Botrytis porri TaxID=87229 RepID=A0A4Z1KVD0_9HELO|nr:uncharacterized protein EAF01_004229 [Botrytis porri]KAF7908474.1 hypothetical protein EAF01_004229 [Botrytis porri]TGO88460.1 hypothetical protein BPOR_0161g00140 [Botrytis porri]